VGASKSRESSESNVTIESNEHSGMPESSIRRLTGVVDGQIIDCSDKPTLTSGGTPWAGFLLETHAADTIKQDVWWGWNKSHAVLVTAGSWSFRMKRSGFTESFVAKAGTTCIFPSGFGETRFSYEPNKFQAICVEVDPEIIDAECCDIGLTPKFGLADESISALLRIMRQEVSEGAPSGILYGESVSLALTAYLKGRFSPIPDEGRRLSAAQVRLLQDYVDSNIANSITIKQLATLLEAPPRQLFRMFRNTFGTTPHHYVLNQRIARARELIIQGKPLVEVAHSVGFSSQSHLCSKFRKHIGITPSRYRAEASRGSTPTVMPLSKSMQRTLLEQ
jgi:AraC family transcriptional regulator